MPSTVEMQERKVRREAKRAKQREASITRAGKMHDARLADQSALHLDYHLEFKGERPAIILAVPDGFTGIGLVCSIQRTYPVMNGSVIMPANSKPSNSMPLFIPGLRYEITKIL